MFTFDFYKNLLKLIKENNYSFCQFSYEDIPSFNSIFLRHDVDINLNNALKIASLEYDLKIKSIFLIQPDSDFYNILNTKTLHQINQISSYGHDIGLHIDASKISDFNRLQDYINITFNYYKNFIDLKPIISFHRPSPTLLLQNIKFDGFIHTYENIFFKQLSYFSDSNHHCFWDKKFYNSINEKKSLQLLIHPIWWRDISCSIKELYFLLEKDNIQQLQFNLKNNIKSYQYLQSDIFIDFQKEKLLSIKKSDIK